MTRPSWMPRIVNIPQTTTWLALIVLGGMWFYHDQDWKELTMMVLSYYFGKQQAGTLIVPQPNNPGTTTTTQTTPEMREST